MLAGPGPSQHYVLGKYGITKIVSSSYVFAAELLSKLYRDKEDVLSLMETFEH